MSSTIETPSASPSASASATPVPTYTVIHCWSAPRSRSTALMYSFDARADCRALDEPLYRRWLVRNPRVYRPYTDQLIHGTPHPDTAAEDGYRWKREMEPLNDRIRSSFVRDGDGYGGDGGGGDCIVFVKHMAKHSPLYDFDNDCEIPLSDNDTEITVEEDDTSDRIKERNTIDANADPSTTPSPQIQHKHMLLIRDPVSILSSWNANSAVHNSAVTPNEVGIVHLLSIYSDLQSRNHTPNTADIAVLDSDDLVADPTKTLTTLCNQLQIPFQQNMLHWNDGPKHCDGPWAHWWYDNARRSTGWSTKRPNGVVTGARRYPTLDTELLPALEVSLGPYDLLKRRTAGYRARMCGNGEAGGRGGEVYGDARNERALVFVGAPGLGRLIPREQAGVSPWDSGVQGGDATWEGIRIYRGKILSLDRHLKRLFQSSKALGFQNVHSRDEIVDAIFRTLAVNGMRDGAYIRLTLTRGENCTNSIDPQSNVYGTTLIILAEWKPTQGKGISLITSSTRKNSPSTCDSKIHHNNMINNILPKIQANLAGAADALMLDLDGFVSNTNVFMIENGVLLTPHADHCLPGITRETVLTLAAELGIPTVVRHIYPTEFHTADEVFTSGTMGGLTPVVGIDGRVIGDGGRGPVTARLQGVYAELPERDGWSTDIPAFGVGAGS